MLKGIAVAAATAAFAMSSAAWAQCSWSERTAEAPPAITTPDTVAQQTTSPVLQPVEQPNG